MDSCRPPQRELSQDTRRRLPGKGGSRRLQFPTLFPPIPTPPPGNADSFPADEYVGTLVKRNDKNGC